MKKLLILMLVLGMASAASAAIGDLTLYPKGDMCGVTVDGTMAATDAEVFYVLIVSEGTVSPLDDTALGTAAPSMAGYSADSDSWVGVIPFTAGLTGGAWVLANAPGEAFKTGTYIDVTISYTSPVRVEAWWFEEGSGTYGSLGHLPWFPEPMTVALLGLGGLFVLRRRK